MNYSCYQIILRLKYFYTYRERCEVLTGYLSVGHWPGGGLGEYVTLDKTFYSLLFIGEAGGATICFHFLPYRILRGGLYLEI